MNLPMNSFNESIESKGADNSLENKTFHERAFSSFASASKKFHMSNVLIIEKICIIVKKYFESKPLLKKNSEEIDILIQYNKKLIQILSKFQEQQNKLITRLRRLEEMHIEYMRVYQLNKGKQFTLPNAHNYQSIFANFSLTKLKFEPHCSQPPQIQRTYKDRLIAILKHHYIHPQYEMQKIIEQKLSKANENQPEQLKLKEILKKICTFNRQVQSYNQDRIFDLIKLNFQIKKNLQDYFQQTQCIDFKPDQKAEQKFINDVVKLHADLQRMDQPLLMGFLKEEKQIRQKLQKQKMKLLKVYEEQFGRLEMEHTFQKQELANVKIQKIQIEREYKDYKNKIQIKKLKNRSSSKSKIMDESKMDLSISRVVPNSGEKESQVQILERKLLKKMGQLDELKKNQADNEMLTKQIRHLMQQNEIMRRQLKKLEANKSVEKSVIKDRSQLISEIRQLKERSQILQKMDDDHRINSPQASISQPKIGKLLSPKISTISHGQQTSQSFIHINQQKQEEERVQKICMEKQVQTQERFLQKVRDDSMILSPNMPQIKDIDLLWNNYESGSLKDEQVSRVPIVRHDSMHSLQAGLENTIRMLESRLFEYEKKNKNYEQIIEKKNEQIMFKQESHDKEIDKLNKSNQSLMERLDELEKKQSIVEHMAVTAYNTVGLLSRLDTKNQPISNKIDGITHKFEEFMDEYQIKFQKNILKDMPGYFNDLSVEINSRNSKKKGSKNGLKRAYSNQSVNLDIMKQVLDQRKKQKSKFEKPVREEKSEIQKMPIKVHFDGKKRKNSLISQNDEDFKLQLSREDSKNPSLIRIPKMKQSEQQLQYSESRHLQSKRSFQSNSRRIKEHSEDIKSIHMKDIDEIPRNKMQKTQFQNVNFEAQPPNNQEKKNPFDNIIFKEVFKNVMVKSDPQQEYLELFQNFQIALKSLELEQAKNKRREIQFQNYLNALYGNRKPGTHNLSLEQKLFGLQKQVKELHQTLETQRKQYGEMFKSYHNQFQKDFNKQLRNLRNQSMTL